MNSFHLHGIVPPMVTPLREDESIDEAGLERQLGRLLGAGIHGLFFLGSTGEQPLLRPAAREQAVRAAVRVAAGRIPVVVGTMASSTAEAVDNIRAAEDAGADAVAVTPPHYYPSRGAEEQLAHYRACSEAARGPLVIYNIPLTTKVQIAPETIARIAELPNVIGIKDSSGDFIHFLRILSLLRGKEGFGLMVGTPPLAGSCILNGGTGAVPGVANLDAATMIQVYDAARAGDLPRLRKLQDRVHALMDIASLGPPIVCFKTGLEMMGVCGARAARPLQPLSPAVRDQLAEKLAHLGLLTQA